MYFSHSIKYTFIALFAMSIHCLNAQVNADDLDMTDVLTIKSPSTKFKSIHIQSHKGLPRLGTQNQYRYIDKYGGLGVNRSKNILVKEGFINYHNMVKMKYLNSYFNDIDKTYLTELTRENQDNKKDIHSFAAQQHLLISIRHLATEELIHDSFCDTATDPKCKNKFLWGGTRDEFVAQEKYAAFVTSHLDELKKWSTTFFKDDKEVAYFVIRHKFGEYDFDKGGFWVKLPPHNKDFTGFMSEDQVFIYEFLPEKPFENNYLNSIENTFPKVLLPMTADKAEAFLNSRDKNYSNKRPSEYIYSAIKMRITYKELGTTSVFPQPAYTYQFEDPIIEFYKDIELTKKIGEINLETPIYNKM